MLKAGRLERALTTLESGFPGLLIHLILRTASKTLVHRKLPPVCHSYGKIDTHVNNKHTSSDIIHFSSRGIVNLNLELCGSRNLS
mmetsp:Transcript_26913/g.39845  ORF Transcript_26913/g.39845 Transcript_26913/m.39845 type:complete len:85 (+) Transcript_26913:355-609(+)